MKFEDFLTRFKSDLFIDSRLFSLLNESEQIVRNQVNYWQKKGQLLRLKKGIYLFSDIYKQYPDPALLAGYLIQTSYLSLEYVLSMHGLIPEGVFAYTSITTKKTKKYENKLGVFYYRHVKENLFFGFDLDDKNIMTAYPEKALLDYIYLITAAGDISPDYFRESMRLQNVEVLNLPRLEEYAKRFAASKIHKALKELKKAWKKL